MLLSHLECLGLRVNFAKSVLYPSQRISFLGTVIDSNEGGGHTRTCTGHSATQGFIQTWSPSPPQRISKDAGTHGLSVFGKSVGPASHAAPWALAETSSSSTRLASQTPPSQGELGLHCSSGPLEEPSVDGMGRSPKHGLQKEGGLDKRLQLKLEGAVRQKTGFRPLFEKGRSHQLPGNAGSIFGPSHLSTRPEGTSRLSLLGQYEGRVLHKSPGRFKKNDF